MALTLRLQVSEWLGPEQTEPYLEQTAKIFASLPHNGYNFFWESASGL